MSSVISTKNTSLPGAWKPGDATPSGYSTIPSSCTSSSHGSGILQESSSRHPSLLSTHSSSPTPKTLSGTTMNMRFMQRRRDKEVVDSSRKRKSSPSEDPSYSSHPNHQPQSREPTTIVTIPSLPNPTSLTKEQNDIVSTATNMDMYGSDIIGRRSFGGFHTCVGETWEAAVAVLFPDIGTTPTSTPKEKQSTNSKEKRLGKYPTDRLEDTNEYEKNKPSSSMSRRRSSALSQGGTPKKGRPILGTLDATTKKRKTSI